MNLSENQIQALLKGIISGQFDSAPSVCEHYRLNSDFNGSTCQDCNKVITGKGFGGSTPTCIHFFEKNLTGAFICTYCGEKKV